MIRTLPLLAAAAAVGAASPNRAPATRPHAGSKAVVSAGGLTAEVYANSVMRGEPVCTTVLPNGFSRTAGTLCAGNPAALVPGSYSVRLSGTLTAPEPQPKWYAFSATVGPSAMVRLWVDDHRLVDAWDPTARISTPAAPDGYGRWPFANMASNVNEFPSNSTGKIVSPESLTDCAAACDALHSVGCVGFVLSPQRDTCYMRKLARSDGGNCSVRITPSSEYAVYTRNSSCGPPTAHGMAPPLGSGDTPTTPGEGCYFLVFVPTIRETRYFNRETYGTNRESVCIARSSSECNHGCSETRLCPCRSSPDGWAR
eukprot:SAG31_NODE_1852_length_7072_cov_12.649792_5_plen_313_part_00